AIQQFHLDRQPATPMQHPLEGLGRMDTPRADNRHNMISVRPVDQWLTGTISRLWGISGVTEAISRLTKVETLAMIKAARIVVQKKVSISTWTGKNEVIHTVNHSIAALITSVNRPKVRQVTGKDKKLTIGRITALISPKTTEMISSATIDSPVLGTPTSAVSSIPGRIQSATQKDAAVTKVRRR